MNKLNSTAYDKLLLQGARLVDPQLGLDEKLDLLIQGEQIVEVGTGLSAEGAETLDLKGQLVIPGMVDAHVHFRYPGQEIKEDMSTGAASAAAGGFTTVCTMPNTSPVVDHRGVLEQVLEAASQLPVHAHPIAAITMALEGMKITEMADLVEAGVIGFSDDGRCVQSAAVMRNAMKYADMLQRPIVSHSQDDTLFAQGVMNESEVSTRLGMEGIPNLAEDVIVARELLMAEYDDTAIHFAHVSTRRSVEMIHEARARGVRVTAEATPHHFTLTDEAVVSFDTNLKMSPPLRSREDREAVIKGLQDGTIDMIVTDHAPHTWEEKHREFMYAPFGITGLETALPLAFQQLIEPGKLSLADWVTRVSVAPRRIFHLPEVRLEKGGRAELTLIQPQQEWTYDPNADYSRARNSPFGGSTFNARATGIIARSRLTRR